MPPSHRVPALILSILFSSSVLHAGPLAPSPDVSVAASGGAVDENCQFLVAFSGVVDDDCGLKPADVQVTAIPGTDNFKVGPVLFLARPLGDRRVAVNGTVLVSDLVASPARLAIRISAADACGVVATNAAEVTIADTTPPSIAVSVDPTQLWPANHRFHEVQAEVRVADNCPNVAFTLTDVTSSEAKEGSGKGKPAGDVEGASLGTPDLKFRLRAERSGAGRIYTITYTATDASRNPSMAAGFVAVPNRWNPAATIGGKRGSGESDRSSPVRCEKRPRDRECRDAKVENRPGETRQVGRTATTGSEASGG